MVQTGSAYLLPCCSVVHVLVCFAGHPHHPLESGCIQETGQNSNSERAHISYSSTIHLSERESSCILVTSVLSLLMSFATTLSLLAASLVAHNSHGMTPAPASSMKAL